MKGKERCQILKEIRQKIAEENDITLVTSECRHKGECAGTCPKCEAELRYLERELEIRRRLGRTVAVAGLAVALTVSAISCDTDTSGRETGGDPLPPPTGTELGGDPLPYFPDLLTQLADAEEDVTEEFSWFLSSFSREDLRSPARCGDTFCLDLSDDRTDCFLAKKDIGLYLMVTYDEEDQVIRAYTRIIPPASQGEDPFDENADGGSTPDVTTPINE